MWTLQNSIIVIKKILIYIKNSSGTIREIVAILLSSVGHQKIRRDPGCALILDLDLERLIIIHRAAIDKLSIPFDIVGILVKQMLVLRICPYLIRCSPVCQRHIYIYDRNQDTLSDRRTPNFHSRYPRYYIDKKPVLRVVTSRFLSDVFYVIDT